MTASTSAVLYNAASQMTNAKFLAGAEVWGYNRLYRLTGRTTTPSGKSPVLNVAYTYNAGTNNGQMYQSADSVSGPNPPTPDSPPACQTGFEPQPLTQTPYGPGDFTCVPIPGWPPACSSAAGVPAHINLQTTVVKVAAPVSPPTYVALPVEPRQPGPLAPLWHVE